MTKTPETDTKGTLHMTRKKWFRLYHGLANDLSLAVAAQQAQMTRGDMLALWLCLLDHASQAAPSGSIAQFEKDETALLLGLPVETIDSALTALRTRKKIDSHQRIVSWDKYQPNSTERVRAMRARRNTPIKTPVMPPAPAPVVRKAIDDDSPAAIAARRTRLQHNNALIIGQPPRGA